MLATQGRPQHSAVAVQYPPSATQQRFTVQVSVSPSWQQSSAVAQRWPANLHTAVQTPLLHSRDPQQSSSMSQAPPSSTHLDGVVSPPSFLFFFLRLEVVRAQRIKPSALAMQRPEQQTSIV